MYQFYILLVCYKIKNNIIGNIFVDKIKEEQYYKNFN